MLTIPGLCWLCLSPLALAHWGICSRCQRALYSQVNVCPRCGLPAMSDRISCGRCLLRPPPWQALVAVGEYHPPLSTLVHQFKFQGATAIAPALGRLLVLQARMRRGALPKPDLILAVPLHRRRAWRRGFNQSDLIARHVSRRLNIPYTSGALSRSRPTTPQHRLSAKMRKRNLRNAFTLEMPIKGRHIVLIDDVVTTGGTVGEITRLLIRHQAATVQIWCLCRTL